MTHRFSRTFWTDHAPAAGVVSLSGPKSLFPAAAGAARPEPPDETACATVVRTLHPDGKPVGLYVPEGYEPHYAYPLIVWLHGTGGDEGELAERMPGISTRNYFGLALRGTRADALERELFETVCRLRREYHIHSERVIVAGFDRGATLALRLLLRRPEWFGGGIAVAGGLPASEVVLSRYRELQGKRVLLEAGARDAVVPPEEMTRTGRLLHAAGLDVTAKTCDAAHEITPRMLAHINCWVMEGLGAVV